jgi:asparagine synthase (glutamine-hydrolysing)
MCGITGIQVFTDEAKNQLKLVPEATRLLEKRGPDDEGYFEHHHTALGHRRLSIIDLSKAGAQPFSDQSGRYTLVLNGEFFNYREHRAELISKGVQFRSESDTEVLLHLWIREKEECLANINGFFAFAVYDKEEESLAIIRDRYGVKPLLYSIDSQRIVFASEMKALLEYGISRELDTVSLQAYLHLNYIPAPDSIFKSVKKLEPGCLLLIQGGKCEKKTYYSISTSQIDPITPSYQEAIVKVRELVNDAVQKRLIADVPLGAFLSGGVDSSIITALASRQTDRLKTFSIGFPDEPYFDETKYAEIVARKFKTDHTVFQVRNEELFANLHETLDYLDEPFADSSALLVYILCKHTRKEVTATLSGDGADELFTGYNKHAAEYRLRNKGLAETAVYAGKALWASLPKSRNTAIGNKVRQFHKFSSSMDLSLQERYWRWAGFTDDSEARSMLVNPCSEQEYEKRKAGLTAMLSSDFNDLLRSDFNLVLQNDMLVKTDLMSMANGLELRTPFLDYRLVDYVFSLPAAYKIDGQHRKKILKDAFRELLPPEILARKKQGFEVPLLKWFKSDLHSVIFDDLLSEQFIRTQGLFELDEINRLKQKLMSGSPGDAVARIWALIVFQYWWKKYGRA